MTTPTPTTTTSTTTALPSRILQEGYGPGAWHGPDLKAALADVSAELAFWRPGPGRHNIAEIALHHAFYARSVRGQISGQAPEPFLLEGEDWFAASERGSLSWPKIQAALEAEQGRLAEAVAKAGAGAGDQVELVLGITCHAVYHAGQVQLIKKLAEA
jgi:hypothetical protein